MNTPAAAKTTAPKVSVLENEFHALLAGKLHDIGVEEPEIAKAAAIGLFRLGARIALRHAVHITLGGAAQVTQWAAFAVTDKLKAMAAPGTAFTAPTAPKSDPDAN